MALHLRAIIQILVAMSLFLNHYEVEGEERLSEAEDLELEKQLKLLNKPAIKTIKGKYGEMYNCVDFYKQPAFDHPLLKNHNFHPKMKPTFSNLPRDKISSNISRPFNIGVEGGGCPTGTVPIRRITKNDLIRMKGTYDSPNGDGIEFNVSHGTKNTKFKGGYKVATVQIPSNLGINIGGAATIFSLHNPQLLSRRQHSGGRIKFQNGTDSIQVGWTVNPPVYGDTRTRLYTYFKAGKLACYNTRCPGFIHLNTAIPLDAVLSGSSYGGPYELFMNINQDTSNGNWWFSLGFGYTTVGFWPAKIFTGLNGYATSAEYGGVVYSPPGVPEPSMGRGNFPVGNIGKDAYCRRSVYYTDKNMDVSLDEIKGLKVFANSPSLYRVIDFPNYRDDSGNTVLYGGPGEHMYHMF